MQLKFNGTNVYAITGGVQIDSIEIYSTSLLNFPELPPSVIAQMRDATDAKSVWMNTVFGLTVSPKGKLLPSNELMTDITYKLLPGYAVNIQEVPVAVALNIFNAVCSFTEKLKIIELYNQFLHTSDLSSDFCTSIKASIKGIDTSIGKISVVNGSLTPGGSKDAVTISGYPFPGSFNYVYDDILGFGDLSVKLVTMS